MLYMKLSKWAKHQGIRYETAWRWFKAGKMPVPVEQTETGTIIVKERVSVADEMEVAIYARVSSGDQKNDLDGQVARLVQYASEKKLKVVCTVTEIGSGLNGHRPKLKKLLSNAEVKGILVEHRDRLMRYGCEYVESTLYSQGRRIIVANDTDVKDDLVQDMIEVLTSFCARLYGRRSAKSKAKKALAAIES
jgi:putative resolvase